MGNLQRLTRNDPAFYPLIGPFLSRRAVVGELGHPCWDDDDKTWFVWEQDGYARGFCAARERRDRLVFCSAYVVPTHRRQGIYRALFLARLVWARGRGLPIDAACTTASLPLHLQHGFQIARRVGRYTLVRREQS